MNNLTEKEAFILKTLHDKVVFSQSSHVSFFLQELITTKTGLAVSEVVSILARFQKLGLINIEDIRLPANEPTNSLLQLPSIFQSVVKYDTGNLENNLLESKHQIILDVAVSFAVYYQKFFEKNDISNESVESLHTILESKIPEDTLNTPISWFCPLCRSKVGPSNIKKTIREYLKDFRQKRFPKCKDRAHRSMFSLQEGNKITISTIPFEVQSIQGNEALDEQK